MFLDLNNYNIGFLTPQLETAKIAFQFFINKSLAVLIVLVAVLLVSSSHQRRFIKCR